MQPTTVVYDKYWTLECIQKTKNEQYEVDELLRNLVALRPAIPPEVVVDFIQIISELHELERSLSITRSAMDTYMYDMEKAIAIISEKIEAANAIGAKQMGKD